jgi:hypothetical protein
MSDSPPAYRSLFWRSSEHLWLAVGTVGLGFASGEPLGLLVGAVLYLLGHVYLPDSGWFRARVDGRQRKVTANAEAKEARDFALRRTQLLDQLVPERRERYQRVVTVCEDISAASASADASPGDLTFSLDTRLRKLDELLWTYLRLLTIGQSLETYLETERRENLAETTAAAAAEVADLERELAEPAASSSPKTTLDTRRKLLTSRRDRLQALQQRLTRVAQARANLELARSEQERLIEQAKLIRADAVAQRNAESLGARIDLSIEHLAETNRWLSDLADFKDLTAQLPPLPPGTMLNAGGAGGVLRTRARMAPVPPILPS